MQIIFDPREEHDGTGTVSEASWDNEHLKAMMTHIFHIHPHERIEKVLVRPSGLRAIIKYIPQDKQTESADAKS